MNIVIIIQARCSSTRLPNKVMLPLTGRTVLGHMIERVRRSRFGTNLVIATTTDPEDALIESICRYEGVRCFRGHPYDLIDRHYMAGIRYSADAVVKIPSDCPLIDPAVIDCVIDAYLAHDTELDYMSNLHPASHPDGNDVEVVGMRALETAWKDAAKPFEREHTTPFIWDNPDRFRIGNVLWDRGLDYSMTHRWVLDYTEDYEFIRAVYKELYPDNPSFAMQDILDLVERRPELKELNRQHIGTSWYYNHLDDLQTSNSLRIETCSI
ncbi:MAG: cytidylyltransferase domain-containing protein [Dissulfurispiraceae bacterium]|jgi:spore coat polysaccharide biosynthesis protein SpsF